MLHLLAGLTLVTALCGCDVLEQLGWKTLLDQSQPIRLKETTGTNGLRPVISIYDEALGALPKDAKDPTDDDLEVHREDYRIAPGDRMRFTVDDLQIPGQQSQLERPVSDTGYVSLPRLKPPTLFIANMTEQQAQDAVIKAYQDVGVLKDPQVSAEAVVRGGRRAYFIGPFQQPGAFQIPTVDFRLLPALGLVGGLQTTTTEWLYVIRSEGRETIKPKAEGDGGEGGPGGPGGPGVPPATLPGSVPLPLPGGTSPLPLPGSETGPGVVPAAPAVVILEPSPASEPSRPDIPKILKDFNPAALPGGRPETEPLTPRNGAPGGNENGTTKPAAGGQGHWMLVGGKWAFVPEAPKPGAEAGVPANQPATGPRNRIIRIPLAPLRAGERRFDIVLRAEDVVVAPPPIQGEFYVMGNVSRPGVYSLTDRKLTVKQALIAAGWLNPLADPTRVTVTRRIPSSDEEQTILIDVGKIVEATTDDYYIKPYDVINVGTNPVAPFLAVLRNAFRATYGVGFVYDRNFADIDSYGPRNNPNH